MDMDNVYDNLQDYNLGESVFKLQEENKRLSALVVSLQDDVKKLCDNVIEMKKTQDNLAKNISELYKTAKAEITRKDRIIADLRSELDDHLFRRNKGSIPEKTRPCNMGNLGIIHENIKDSRGVPNTELHSYDKSNLRDTVLSRSRDDYTERAHREYLPVLEDVDLYLPDDRRYAQGKKRQLEERPEERIDNKRSKFQYEEYNRRFDRAHRSRDKRYDERWFYDDRRVKEERRLSESSKFSVDYRSDNHLDSYSDRRFRRYEDDRRSSEESQCLNKDLRESGKSKRKPSHERKLEANEGPKHTEKVDRKAVTKKSESSNKNESHHRKTKNKEQLCIKEDNLTKGQAFLGKAKVKEESKPTSDKNDVPFRKTEDIGSKDVDIKENANPDEHPHVPQLDVGSNDNTTDLSVHKSSSSKALSDNNLSHDVFPLSLNNSHRTQQNYSHNFLNDFSSELVENNLLSNSIQLNPAEPNNVKSSSSDSTTISCASNTAAKHLLENKNSKSKKTKGEDVNINVAKESLKLPLDNELVDLPFTCDGTKPRVKADTYNSISNSTEIVSTCLEPVADSKLLINKSKDKIDESCKTCDTSGVSPVSDITSPSTNRDSVIDTVTNQVLNVSNISDVSSSSLNVSLHRKKRRRCIMSLQN